MHPSNRGSARPRRPCPAFLGLITAVVLAACGASVSPSAGPGGSGGTGAPATSAAASSLDGRIDIGGGRHLDISCRGSGSPVVVLDAGLGNEMDVWSAVTMRVAEFTTVCAYNRAGLGTSDLRPPPHGAASAVDDLHALLGAAGLPAPYVLVGASFGGLDAQLYARRYPSDTAGVVLVDAIAPEWDRKLEARLPPALVAERRAIPNGEDLTNEDIRASELGLLDAPPFPTVPLVVLRHGHPFEMGPDWPTAEVESLWTSLQEGLAAMSPQSALLLAADSGHRIHQDQPDLVADAIHAVVDPARWPPVVPDRPAFGAGAPEAAPAAIQEVLAHAAADGIHLVEPGATAGRLVVPNREGERLGEPSMDGRATRVAFASRAVTPAASGPQGDPRSDVWVADLASGARTLVVADAAMPQLSPDGTTIAFSRRGHEYLVDAAGGEPRDLGEGGCAVWSPDGTQLAMCTNDDTVFVMGVAGGRRTAVPTGPGPNQPTAWSPDGSRLALSSTRDGNPEIYLVGVDGSQERRLTDAPGGQVGGPWLPEGLLVASSLPDADEGDWFLVDPATGTASVLPWLHGVPDPMSAARP